MAGFFHVLNQSELTPVASATGTNASRETERGCRMFKIHHLHQLVCDVINLGKKTKKVNVGNI